MKRCQLAILLALIGVPVAASAQAKPKPLKIAPIVSKLWVLQAPQGHHIFLLPPWERKALRAHKLTRLGRLMLFGKRGTYHRLRTLSAFSSGTQKFTQRFADNRVRDKNFNYGGKVTYKTGTVTLQCGKRTTKLTLLEGTRRDRVLRSGKFFEPKWNRTAVALARDHALRYFYVDRIVNGQGYRVWRGQRGALKRVSLQDVAVDSQGMVFRTRKGSLVLTFDAARSRRFRPVYTVKWVTKGGKEQTLKFLPPAANRKLIYTDIGVYTGVKFGTPCDVY